MRRLFVLLFLFALCCFAFAQDKGGSSEWKSDGLIKEGRKVNIPTSWNWLRGNLWLIIVLTVCIFIWA